MFTFQLDPHHIWHPEHGWLTPDLVREQDISVGPSFQGGPPDEERSRHLEADASTGWVAHTYLSDEEEAVRAMVGLIADIHRAEVARRVRERKESRDATLRERAKTDPAFAALCDALGLRDIGIRLDD